jgi:hypothetical protein
MEKELMRRVVKKVISLLEGFSDCDTMLQNKVVSMSTKVPSNKGRVCSLKMLKIIDKSGYKTVNLRSKREIKCRMVRHLVAKAFNGLKLIGFDSYIEGNKSERYSKKLTKEQVEEIRNSSHLSCREAGKKFDVSYQMISLIRRNKCWLKEV